MREELLIGNAPFGLEFVEARANVSSHSNDGQQSLSVEHETGVMQGGPSLVDSHVCSASQAPFVTSQLFGCVVPFWLANWLMCPWPVVSSSPSWSRNRLAAADDVSCVFDCCMENTSLGFEPWNVQQRNGPVSDCTTVAFHGAVSFWIMFWKLNYFDTPPLCFSTTPVRSPYGF